MDNTEISILCDIDMSGDNISRDKWVDIASKKQSDQECDYCLRLNLKKRLLQWYFSFADGSVCACAIDLSPHLNQRITIAATRTRDTLHVYVNGCSAVKRRFATNKRLFSQVGGALPLAVSNEAWIKHVEQKNQAVSEVDAMSYSAPRLAKRNLSEFPDIAVYTVNIGNYDSSRSDLTGIVPTKIFASSARESRLPKILAHKYVSSNCSIYLDSNYYLKPGIKVDLLVELLGDYEMLIGHHPTRNCVYSEIDAAIRRVADPHEKEILRQQYTYYKSIGYPEHNGLYSYQPLVRRHTQNMNTFCEAWWAELCRWSYRDQVSFPVILSRYPGLRVKIVNLADLVFRVAHLSKG
jgi:hypothetical protein